MKPQSVVDLHMHSTFSDGRLSPTELVHLLATQQVEFAALTDHDTTDGIEEAKVAVKEYPELTLITGVEISADHPQGKGDLHILGYFIDHEDQVLQQQLEQLKNERVYRTQKTVDKLSELGLPVEFERVKQIAGNASIGRPHIAQAMLENGYIASIKEAFQGYLEEGGLAYMDRARISMEDAVGLIQEVGGVAVVAHPLFVENFEWLLPKLVAVGVVGLEAHYAEFSEDQRAKFRKMAEKFGLLALGGSDYHGLDSVGEHLPGSAGPDRKAFFELERLAGRH